MRRVFQFVLEHKRTAALAVAMFLSVSMMLMGESAKMSGQGRARAFLGLPGAQKELLQALVRTGKPGVLVLVNGRPLTLSWAAKHIPAILETWQLGHQYVTRGVGPPPVMALPIGAPQPRQRSPARP